MSETQLRTQCDRAGETFQRNAAALQGAVDGLLARLGTVRLGGTESARRRHVERGKLLPRTRVDTLLDPGSPFLELSPLAANGMYGDEAPGSRHHHRHRSGLRP